MKDSTVRARVNSQLKGEVQVILGGLGMTTSDAINSLFYQIYLNKGLPFEIKVPNQTTENVLKASAIGNQTKPFDSMDDLFKDLDI